MRQLKLIIGILTLFSFGFPATHIVDLAGGGDFTSIHAAVDNADAGDTILVMSGTFLLPATEGAILVTRELHIMGSGYDLPENGGSYLYASTAIFNFSAEADGSTLRGFRMRGSGAPLIDVLADDMVIENNHIVNNYDQGWLLLFRPGVSSDTLRNNIIGCETSNYRPGVQVYQTTDVTLSNNIFYNNSWYGSVYVDGNTNAVVANNLFLSTPIGVYYTGGSTATIVNNIFMNGNGAGGGQIYQVNGSPTISHNCFYNNTTDGNVGNDAILEDPDFINFDANDTYNSVSYDEENFDFHLLTGATADSSSIDAGYPLIDFNDLDASVNDLGNYGWKWPMGTNGAPRMPVINQISVTPSGVAPGGTISIEVIGRFGD